MKRLLEFLRSGLFHFMLGMAGLIWCFLALYNNDLKTAIFIIVLFGAPKIFGSK